MNRRLIPILTLALLLGAAWADDKEKKSDLQEMKGRWKASSGESSGTALPNAFLDNITFVVKGDMYTFKEGDDEEEGTLKLDATKKPAQMDVNITKGKDKGKKQYGIYQLDGDTLKICMAKPEQERPKDFTTKEGSEHFMLVFKRQLCAGPPE
jgi:uncharacterized protein (TIGR03067 family)